MSDLLDSFFSELDILEFIENKLILSGKPMSYRENGRYAIAQIMRYAAHTLPRSTDARPIICAKGRQIGMSTASAALSLYFLYSESNKAFLHAFPEIGQSRRHSQKTLIEMITDSIAKGKLPESFLNKKGTQSASQKDFYRNNTLFVEGLSTDARRIRGLSVSGLIIFDEFQNTTIEAFKNALEASSNSHYPRINHGKSVPFMSFGTPENESSLFFKMWNQSDKREFFFKCPHCGHSFPAFYDMISKVEVSTNLDTGYTIKCLDKDGIGCGTIHDKRKQVMLDGEWRATITEEEKQRNLEQFNDTHMYTGFYVPQFILQPKEVIDHKRMNDPIKTFYNEVLGRFYTSSNESMTPDMIRGYTTTQPDTSKWDIPSFIVDKKTFLGVDWGLKTTDEISAGAAGSYTTISVISQLPTGQIKLEFAERLNTSDIDEQIARVEEIARRYSCIKICADRGAGEAQRQRLTKNLGELRFTAVQWEGFLKYTHKYDVDTNLITTNKNAFFEEFFDLLKQHKFCFPNSPDAEEKIDFMYEHISNLEVETKDVNGIMRRIFNKKHNKQTDGFASFLFAYTAFLAYTTNYFKDSQSMLLATSVNQKTSKATSLSNFSIMGGKDLRGGKRRR